MIELNIKSSFVDGKWINEGKNFPIINPSTGEILSEIQIATQEVLDEAIKAAKTAQISWSKVAIKDRAAIILKLADIAEQNLEMYAKIDCYHV